MGRNVAGGNGHPYKLLKVGSIPTLPIMQTFLPYPDIQRSVECLDFRRLGKQRVEAYQILKVNQAGSGSWFNHPAARMWREHAEALTVYMDACILEWVKRGYKNTMKIIPVKNYVLPGWFGNLDFHASHRSNLLRKDLAWYGKYGWTEPVDLPYIWPIKDIS